MDKRLAPVAFSAPVQFAAAGADGTRRFSGIAYGGGIVTDHPFYDRVAFDLASTKLKDRLPALLDHEQRAGVIDSSELNGQINVGGKLFSDRDGAGKEVADLADRGMPWQMSVRIYPGQVDEIAAGTQVRLNGHLVQGPLTIFRNNRVREVSFVTLGADDKTSAEIFTIGGETPRAPKELGMEFTHTQADVDKAVAAEKAKTDAEKVRGDKAVADLDVLQKQFAATRNATRTAALKEHFTASGREFKDELAKPYLDMTDEQFAAVVEVFKAQKPPLDPKLMKEHANGGTGDTAVLDTPAKIVAAAQKFTAEQKALGIDVDVATAVSHVTFEAKKAA